MSSISGEVEWQEVVVGSDKPVFVRSHLRAGSFVNAYFRSLPSSRTSASVPRGSGCLGVIGTLLKVTIWIVGLSFALAIVFGLLLIDLVAYLDRRTHRHSERVGIYLPSSAHISAYSTTTPPAPSWTVADVPRGMIFYLSWIVANGLAGALSVALLIMTHALKEEPLRIFVSPGLVGLVFGIMQWLILRNKLPSSFWWVPATIGGMYLAALSGVMTYFVGLLFKLFDAMKGGETRSLLEPIIMTAGLMFGVWQWLVLSRRVSHSSLWIIVSAVGWCTSGFLLVALVGVELNTVTILDTKAWLSAGIAFGIVTGIPLFLLSRHRASAA